MNKRKPAVTAGKAPLLTPRRAALELLVLQEQNSRPLDQVLAEYPAERWPADRRDRQLLRALVFGVLRWRGFLDFVLARYSRHPLTKMKPLTLAALRLGLVQLLFFDRLPPAAALDETIRALKAARQPAWLTGYVNGLLRGAARDRAALLQEAGEQGDLLSTPPWLRKRRQERLGEEATRHRCRADNRPPPLVLRVNRRRIGKEALRRQLTAAGLTVEPARLAPAALVLPDYHGRVEELPGFAAGYFTVQDEAAQLVTILLTGEGQGEGEPTSYPGPPSWLDACAGLGGKTTHLAELLPPRATLIALEPHAGRFARLVANLARLGVTTEANPDGLASRCATDHGGQPGANVHPAPPREAGSIPVQLLQQTLEEFACRVDSSSAAAPFQGILVDAPCSGLGVIRRHPDIRWNRRAEDLPRYQARQIDLLQAAAGLLAPGGALVYAVCSNEPEENEEVIREVLHRCPALKVADPRPWLPTAAAELVDREGFFRCGPEIGLDGFFAARLQRE